MTDQVFDDVGDVLDVVVVGAGFAGLAAARELDAMGLTVRVLEASPDHLGGRAFSFDARAGDPRLRFDHGAEYVGDAQDAIMTQIRELLPPDALVNGAALRAPYPWEVMVLDQRRYVFRSDQSLFGIPGCPPQLGFLAALGMIGLLAEMTLIEWSIDVMEPWKGAPDLLALDQIDTWSWLQSKRWVEPTVRDLVRISVEALLSVEPSEISPYYLLWYTACNDGFLNEINDDCGGPQQYWLRGGTDQLADRYAEPVRGSIRQGVRVRTIDHRGAVCAVTTASGEVLRARKVLVAMSPHTAGRLGFEPPAPLPHQALMAQKMGRTIKCQVFYRTRWWHETTGGKAYDGYVGGADYPVLWVMDNSPPEADADGGPFVLMTFTVGTQADTLATDITDEKVVRWVTDALATLFDDERARATSPDFVRLVRHDWMPTDPMIGGGPNTVLTLGALTSDVGRALDASLDDKVFFASAENAKRLRPRSRAPHFDLLAPENQPTYTNDVLDPRPGPPYFSKYSDMRADLGYMSGAMESGRYVAHEIARALGRPDALPTASAAAPLPPPGDPAPHAPADVVAVLAALRAKIEATPADAIRGWGLAARAAGRGGGMSWLREVLVEELTARGHVEASAGDHGALRAVRDFAIATVTHARTSAADAAADVREHLARIAAHAAALDDHLVARLAP